MYKNQLACAIKVDGKVLREDKDTVYLPFNSEYTILLKNLNSTKCVVSLEIDGRDVGDGNKFIVHPGQSVEIERFITNGNLDSGNRFKFIERTSKIEQHRGIKIEDGLLCIKYKFEVVMPKINTFDNYLLNTTRSIDRTIYSKGANLNSIGSTNVFCDTQSFQSSVQPNDAGITVEGAESSQKFSTSYVGQLETTESTMVIKLLGDTGQSLVTEAVTVKRKQSCKTCGTKNAAKLKFCGECGTALKII